MVARVFTSYIGFNIIMIGSSRSNGVRELRSNRKRHK
jgi:hypothetical protein